MEQKARGSPENMGDAVKGCLIPKIKTTIGGCSMNTYLMVITGGNDLTTAGARCCGEQTFQRPSKAAV